MNEKKETNNTSKDNIAVKKTGLFSQLFPNWISDPKQTKDNTFEEMDSHIWLKFEENILTLLDKKILESSKEWLTDSIINASQYLLKQRFPEVKGLQNVLLNSKLDSFEPIKGTKTFVQIVNDSGNHWIVLSNARVIDKSKKDKHCFIYDSRCQSTPGYSEDVWAAIGSLMTEDYITVDIPYVSNQIDGHQCGLYAIAIAYLLCAGEEPSSILISNSSRLLRRHLLKCLSEGKISRFPTGSQTIIDTFTI